MAKKQSAKWEQIFNGAAILQPEGLSTLLDRFIEEFKNQDVHQSCRPIHLYLEALTRITASQLNVFIDALLRFERIDYYEFQQVLSSIPINWTNKISFKNFYFII